MTEKKLSLADQRRSTPEGRISMAAARLAISASRMLASAFSARADIDQKALAGLIGVTEGRVSQVLHGDGNVHVATLARYMTALGYEVELTAKSVDASAPPLKARKPRRSKRPNRDRRPLVLQYQMGTLRDTGVGVETIELTAEPGEAPPMVLTRPVLVSHGEPGERTAQSAASDLIRERAIKAFARA
jgi:transcriptional regulator with XRE-family HTH domain